MSRKHQFKTEVNRMLELVIHSLYSNKEIFLRELISNASDAIDRARFDALKDESILEGDSEWKIKLAVDKEAKTLTISDNGVGMTAEEVENNIGTVANSGTKKFLEQYKDSKENLPPELIGQFGVGFYAAFMVADKVTVLTRRGGAGKAATRWESSGDGYYTMDEAEREHRGTDVILHLTSENEQYLEEWELRKIVKKYSDYVEHPITMDIRREEKQRDENGKEIEGAEPKVTITEETLNSQKAIWLRPKNEISADDYNEFYKHISHDWQEPMETIHWNVEGQTEFRALVYIPKKPLWDMFMPENRNRGLQLYVRRVFITDNCEELVPQYLNFIRGVVDSSDLPLNVSREMLQEARALRIIKKNIVKKVLDTLADWQANNPDRYQEFWTNFGNVLKGGLREDYENGEKLQKLLVFESSSLDAGKRTSLEEYVSRMPESQKEIYYVLAENRKAAENTPQLEAFKARGYEVLFMTDAVDEWVIPSIDSFKDKRLRCITKGDVELDTEEEKKDKEAKRKEDEETNKDLVAKVKELLGDKVKDVKLSNRLTESACCLVGDEYSMSPQMEKLMKAMKQEVPVSKMTLELNPAHTLIASMRDLLAKEPDSTKLADFAELLYCQACLMANVPVEDPLKFSHLVSNLMADSLK